MTWRTSSFSANGGSCVQISWPRGGVAVRDSKNGGGPTIAFPPGDWRAFVASMRR